MTMGEELDYFDVFQVKRGRHVSSLICCMNDTWGVLL